MPDRPVPTTVDIAPGVAVGGSPAQVILRWHVQHGIVAIPKSVRAERNAANLAVWDFALDGAEMDRIDGLGG